MRIISQDKEFDLPYEETTLRAFTNGKNSCIFVNRFGK